MCIKCENDLRSKTVRKLSKQNGLYMPEIDGRLLTS